MPYVRGNTVTITCVPIVPRLLQSVVAVSEVPGNVMVIMTAEIILMKLILSFNITITCVYIVLPLLLSVLMCYWSPYQQILMFEHLFHSQ